MWAQIIKNAAHGLAFWWYVHREVPREELVSVTMNALWVGFERFQAGSAGSLRATELGPPPAGPDGGESLAELRELLLAGRGVERRGRDVVRHVERQRPAADARRRGCRRPASPRSRRSSRSPPPTSRKIRSRSAPIMAARAGSPIGGRLGSGRQPAELQLALGLQADGAPGGGGAADPPPGCRRSTPGA